jgi:alanine racemase
MHTRPNWAEVSLSTLAHNYRAVRQHLSEQVVPCCVVKCDAYGHGVVVCSQQLERQGAEWLGVTSTEEGVAVREGGVKSRIMVMTGFWRGEEEAVIRHALTPAIATLEHVEALERAAEVLARPQKSVAVHLKLDTGMGRLGLALGELPKMIERLKRSPFIALEGVFSHLASSEVLHAGDAKQQIERFKQAIAQIEDGGLSPKYRHLANTAATQARPETWNNMTRPGLALYGYQFQFDDDSNKIEATINVKPVMSWKTRIISLRDFPAGQSIGYNGRFVTKAPSKIAVIPVGYGDGFTRHLSNKGRVIVRDQYAPIVGNVSMDLTTIDVTDVPGASVGDEVILIGSSPNCAIPASEHAKHAGTIIYEILCGLSPRVPRIYVE